jgi:hypothetical protein
VEPLGELIVALLGESRHGESTKWGNQEIEHFKSRAKKSSLSAMAKTGKGDMVSREHVARLADFARVDPEELADALEVPPGRTNANGEWCPGFAWKHSVVSFLLAWARGRMGWKEPVLSKAEKGRLEREQILAENMKDREMEVVSHTAGAKSFIGMLRHKWGRCAIGRAWRQLLDNGGVNRVGFNKFCHAARSIGFPGNVKHLFDQLDGDQDGVIRLGDLDAALDAGILTVQRLLFGVGPKGILEKRSGKRTLEEAWALLDVRGNGHIHRDPCAPSAVTGQRDHRGFTEILLDLGFSGPSREIFEMLDLDGGSFITKDELVFLENWCVPKVSLPLEGRLLNPTPGFLAKKAAANELIARLKAQEDGSNSLYERITSKPRGPNPPLPDLNSIRQSFLTKSHVRSPAAQERQTARDKRPPFPSKPKPLLDNAATLSLPDLRRETAMRSLNFSTKYGSPGAWAPAALAEKPSLFSTFNPSSAEMDEWDAKLKKQAAEAVERAERGEPPPD